MSSTKKSSKSPALNETVHSASSQDDKKNKKKPKATMASVSDTMGFIFECGFRVQLLFFLGMIAAVLHGLVFPALAYLFSNSFSSISGAAFNGLEMVRQMALTFVGVGVYALCTATAQGWCFEIIAFHASHNFRLSWFNALLHQDPAFFDVYDIGGIAAQIGSNSSKYRRGTGRKFGEGIQFLTTGIGGLAYAFYSSWQTALVVLGIVPFVASVSMMLISLNQTKGSRAAESYKEAGSVAYSAVSAIKTVLSLNAVKEFLRKYKDATASAYTAATRSLLKVGFAHGAMLGSFFLFYFILTLFGTFLLYRDIADTGCDPSGAILTNETCSNSGPGVFGAMLGIAFSAQGISQVGNFLEAFALARVAAHEALIAIKRIPGAPEETIYKSVDEDDALNTTTRSRNSKTENDDIESSERRNEVKAILPTFEIDSSSPSGLKPEIKGSISIRNVHFSYPTRPNDPVLKGLSTEIAAGQTVALVGPSGGGKSSIVAMLERFYDPLSGSILLDGVNLKDINVTYLRKSIGYVGQEPTLFATTIRGNIRYGNPDATDEEIEQAARLANAHDFITAMTDGYDTQVGDKGSQISGGQKQRIAIARVLVGNPRILLLDEATSALDSESELVVQDALDHIVAQKQITTIIVAHRLSTIRNADVINVIKDGRVVEQGNHDQLMAAKTYYRNLVEKQEGGDTSENGSGSPSRSNSASDLQALVQNPLANVNVSSTAHIEFRNVTFSYPSRPKKNVLEDFSLVIKQGQTVALVGPSGGGKSTTVGLIERFYDPNAGQVLYLGEDLKSLNVSWLRSQLSFVGQEPVLFNMSIAENIVLGLHGVSRAEIEHAARQANAHDFIMEFPEGYNTPVGSRGTQLSGGQKQRVAIARALVRKPKVLLLDEATSALDNESESIVQEAIDKLMQSRDHTVIVIAHRLSTIRNADAIAMIADGKLVEYGSHDELIERPHGRYKRLHESSKRRSTVDSMGLRRSQLLKDHHKVDAAVDEDEEIDWEAKFREEEEKAFSAARAREMAKPDVGFMFFGGLGAIVAGGVFPAMGILFSATINLLFQPVYDCPQPDGTIPLGFVNCQAYFDSTAASMRQRSFEVAGFWALVLFSCLLGNIVTYWGFGTASERLNKRVRDSSFEALLRQEIAFFDKRSVGNITSQLQDDAARIHAFSGEPVRALIVALAAVVTGVVISLIYMWPFALVAIGCIPLMGAAQAAHVNRMMGSNIEEDNKNDELNSPGGIIVETLLNMRTVSALALEDIRFDNYVKALHQKEPNYVVEAFTEGLTSGLSMFVQQSINALEFYFGGWLLFTFPDKYTFSDFLIANFSVLFALFGLGSAFQDMSDRKEVEKSAGRIFYLLDRKSSIDPLGHDGKERVETKHLEVHRSTAVVYDQEYEC